jgi:hypothetical protein
MVLITTWDMAGGGPVRRDQHRHGGSEQDGRHRANAGYGTGFRPATEETGRRQRQIQASLCAVTAHRLGILRYAPIRSEPIASMKAEALADAMAPTLQRYLVGNIS